MRQNPWGFGALDGKTMIEGTFDVAIETPRYHRRGVLALKSSGERIAAKLDIGDEMSFEFMGTCADKDFEFEGAGEFGRLGAISYEAKGNVWGNSVTVQCATDAGKIEVFGTRLSTAAGAFKSSHEYVMAGSTGDFAKNEGTMYSGLYADGG